MPFLVVAATIRVRGVLVEAIVSGISLLDLFPSSSVVLNCVEFFWV